MEKLREEMEKKKKMALAAKQGISGNSTENGATNFIRQRDLEVLRQHQLEEEQRKLDQVRDERRQKQLQEEAAHNEKESKRLMKTAYVMGPCAATISPVERISEETLASYQFMTPEQIKSNLRDRKQPITLFGETSSERVERLLAVIIGNDQNESSKKRKSEEIASDKDGEIVNSDDEEDQDHIEDDNQADNASQQSVEQQATKRPRRDPNEPVIYYDPTIQHHKIEGYSPEKIVYKFFRSLIKQWELDLSERSSADKGRVKGRNEVKAQKQCKDHIRPLFRLLKKKEVPPDIMHNLHSMVQWCEEGNFVKANDEYMRTAIGNAPWPMGLTMVGIHERSGRERISTAKVSNLSSFPRFRHFF